MRYKIPTWTDIVLRTLIETDDFLQLHELCERTNGTSNQISAALHHLEQRHAVAHELSKGLKYYFACPEKDTRIRTMKERVPEEKPRKLRRVKQ